MFREFIFGFYECISFIAIFEIVKHHLRHKSQFWLIVFDWAIESKERSKLILIEVFLFFFFCSLWKSVEMILHFKIIHLIYCRFCSLLRGSQLLEETQFQKCDIALPPLSRCNRNYIAGNSLLANQWKKRGVRFSLLFLRVKYLFFFSTWFKTNLLWI